MPFGVAVAAVVWTSLDIDLMASAFLLAVPLTFLLGAEREGLPDELAADCPRVTIELPGGAESLNVAAAGAIALHAAHARRRAKG